MRVFIWFLKLVICILYDFFDMTMGRFLFVTPFAGELVGVVLCVTFFGWRGALYGVEALDMTEQFDGFIPLATFIALANRPKSEDVAPTVEGQDEPTRQITSSSVNT